MNSATDGPNVTISGNLPPSLPALPTAFKPSITFGVFLSPMEISGFRNYGFPSFELTRTLGSGPTFLLKSPEITPVCLTGIRGNEQF